MFKIECTSSFSAAHNLTNYKGKCEKLHGHNWKISAVVSGPDTDKTGMIMDFHELKNCLNKVLETLDHKYLNEIKPFIKNSPTSENIARFIFKQLAKLICNKCIKLESVSVWETDTSRAIYLQ
jgi:6-pyruvoyltetrahydropterin/6-carboxytetrahydropterin synthase